MRTSTTTDCGDVKHLAERMIADARHSGVLMICHLAPMNAFPVAWRYGTWALGSSASRREGVHCRKHDGRANSEATLRLSVRAHL
jgi:hypothetical protein